MGYMHLLVLLLCFFLCQIPFSSLACRRDESLALIEFNQTFVVDASLYPLCGYSDQQKSYSKTSSWNTTSRDCCLWDGVYCDEMTGHVIELDLSCSQLVGTIDSNSTLFQLSHLQRLNLSWNGFDGSEISPKFGEFSNLTHLDLYNSSFRGQIPTEISHLSKLRSLILPEFREQLILGPRNFELLLQNLTQLRELDLSYVDIFSTIPRNFSPHITTLMLGDTGLRGMLPESIFHLPNLQVLDLGSNDQLSGYFPKTKWNSRASLRVLYLDSVNFSGDMLPESLGYLSSLELLLLDSCNLSGSIPKTFSNLTRIEYLILENNSLNGVIPSWIFSLPSLFQLNLGRNHFSGQLEDFKYNNSLSSIDLSENQLQGPLPKSLQNLVNITELDLSSNNFSGNVDVSIFSNLKQLEILSLSYNSISLTNDNKVKSTLPESLLRLDLAACEVKDLELLRSTKHLLYLDLSLNKIQGRIPDWSNWMHLGGLNLSHNMLTSIDQIPPLAFSIDLRSNFLQGSLPILPRSIQYFLISNNNLTGEIPPSICDLNASIVLDLARNNLMGEVPQCLGNMSKYIEVLDMQHNNLSGKLQITFGFGSGIKSFNLHGNKLEGEIPRSLANCKQLEVLDLGNNRFNDTFPMWLGTLPNLQVLSLRSNKLHGPIIMTSRMDKLFPELRMLDLSSNAFTEELPTSLFHQLKAMRRNDQTIQAPRDGYYQDSVTVVTKGNELQVVRILSLYTTIDLSNNKFEGHIPKVLGDLISLRMLNLSHNGLQGYIPPSLGNLSVVESFDLSSNQLSGEIPQQLASLTFLAVLNLSHNHLEGCIPRGFQFNAFENCSYEGNDALRGFPVSNDCGSSRIPETNNTTNSMLDEESDSTFLSELSWKVVLMGYGSGLFVGFIISYVMLSSRNPNWLSWIAQELEYMIAMRRRKKQRNQRHYRRRNNGV